MSGTADADKASSKHYHGLLKVTVERFVNGEFVEIGQIQEMDAGTWRWTHTYDPSGGAQRPRGGIEHTQGSAKDALHAEHDRVVAGLN